jgi:hypothetical protein
MRKSARPLNRWLGASTVRRVILTTSQAGALDLEKLSMR